MNIKTIMGAMFALTLPALALPEAPDMDTALAQAKTEKKDIFVDFTGTDWCTACIHLRTKIVESEAFDKAYGNKYILVSVDFPRNPALVAKIPDEEKRRRENLLMSYRIEGLPGVVLMDENGMPYEIIHGARRTPEEYMPLMEAGLKKRATRDAAFAEAAKLSGMDKARALHKGLEVLPLPCREKYVSVIREINALDPDNTLGYAGYGTDSEKRVAQFEELRAMTSTFAGKFSPDELKDSIRQLDEFLARPDIDPEVRQAALSTKGDSYAFLRDYMKMYECYKAALEAAPNSRAAKRIRANVENFEQNVLPQLRKQQ